VAASADSVKGRSVAFQWNCRDETRSVPLTQSDIQRKRVAAECFRSQLMPPDGHGPPVLPPFVMRRLLAVGEVVFV
jgi:hypothetical protein